MSVPLPRTERHRKQREAVIQQTLAHVNKHRERYTIKDLEQNQQIGRQDGWSAYDADENFVGYCFGNNPIEAIAYAIQLQIPIHHLSSVAVQYLGD